MEFFETFWVWLDGRLIAYVSDHTVRVAIVLSGIILPLGTIYVMLWGYSQMAGKIEQPFAAGLERIILLAVVLGVGLHLWLYHELIVDTFYTAPAQLTAAVVGASDPVTVIDTIWASGAQVAENLEAHATPLGFLNFTIMAFVIRIVIGILCVYTMFLIALSKVGLAVLLALGPLFVVMMLFEQTRHFFRSWIAQISNYGLITVIAVMVAALLLDVVQQYATATLARGPAIQIVDALNLVLICVLALLFMMQVPQLAASLAGGGVPVNTFGLGRWTSSLFTRPASALTQLGARHAGSWLRGKATSRGSDPKPRSDLAGASTPSTRRLVSRNSIEPSHR